MIVGYKKKKKESRYKVLHPETGSDSPIGSDRESGCDTAYRVVIDCERRRVTAYTQDGTRVVFQGDKHDILPHIVYESRCQGQ